MKRTLKTGLLIAALTLAGLCQAQTLRWASQGDPQTMDPHSQNESMTNMMNGQVYEGLVTRDKKLGIAPALATEWKQVSPLVWRFKLRPGVKFHDGSPFTADDVVFSIERGQAITSQINNYAKAVGTPKKVDELTVEFHLSKPNPIFLEHMAAPLWMMSKSWSEAHKVTRPLDFKNKEETFASMNANGTGPYMLVSRAPGIKTTYKRNPNYWGKVEGNVQEIVYTPIANDATRLAALISGEIDFVLDPAPRDVPRLRNTAGIKVIDGPENRIVFIGMDQHRDELLHGSVKGKNPFKDIRVRKALYHAIDIETMKTKLMNGLSVPTGGLTPSPLGGYNDPAIESRLPYDVALARKLMAEAGYADGFEVTLDCPNNRYINDEEICIALASMWAQLKVKVRVNAMPRVNYFPKLEKWDTSMYMLGWGGAVTDAEPTLTPVLRNNLADGSGIGFYNYGRSKNDKFDAMAAATSVEPDAAKREGMVKAALKEFKDNVHTLPLHRQMIPWAARSNVSVVHRADNWLEVQWISIK
ncbi:MAG: ABC transporter substrate-binding protein [Burkholderiales bacterium]|nr:ABC transporter substrate-binding protein [Burkholderiales bacterium]